MKVTVDKCPWTGQLFEDPKLYASHLRKLRREQQYKRDQARIAEKFEEFLAPLYQLNTTDEIAAWLTENYMAISGHFGPKWSNRRRYIPTADDYVVFEIRPLAFNPTCATTHSAPRGQKRTGWSKDCPHVSEPGWQGRIDIYRKGKVDAKDLFNTDHLRAIGINAGSGGGGSEHLSYELTLFNKDFPKLAIRAGAHETLKAHGEPGLDSNGNKIDQGKTKLFW